MKEPPKPKETLLDVLARNGNNQHKAAKELGVTQSAIYLRLKSKNYKLPLNNRGLIKARDTVMEAIYKHEVFLQTMKHLKEVNEILIQLKYHAKKQISHLKYLNEDKNKMSKAHAEFRQRRREKKAKENENILLTAKKMAEKGLL